MEVVEKLSDRIILINHGEIVADGNIDELKNKSMEGSLEKIFNQLTGFNEYEKIAKDIVSTVGGEYSEGF
jgi:ABC-2 type transport system ATP-binding protein